MTAVLCGNLRAEIVSSAGIRLQRFTSSPPLADDGGGVPIP